MQIKKQFKSIRQAQNYRARLYSKFNTVQLISWPNFSESGIYIFYVK